MLLLIFLINIQELLEICHQTGIRIEYLPSYSPDLNPIEKSFAQLKAWMRTYKDIDKTRFLAIVFGFRILHDV